MHIFVRSARVFRPLVARHVRGLNSAASLEVLAAVHRAQKAGWDGELALQAIVQGSSVDPAATISTTVQPNEPPPDQNEALSQERANDAVETEAQEEDFAEEEENELEEEEESPLANVHLGPYPTLAAHALLHGHIKAGRLLQASALVFVQLRHGVKFKTRSLEELVDALCPPASILPGLPFTPTIQLPSDSMRIFGDEVERLTRYADFGTAMAHVLVNTAREHRSPRTNFMYRRIVDALILQRKLSIAAGIYAQLVRDWHHRVWLTGVNPHDEPLDDPVAPPAVAKTRDDLLNAYDRSPPSETADSATPSPQTTEEQTAEVEPSSSDVPQLQDAEGSDLPTNEVDGILLDLYTADDEFEARRIGLNDPSFIIPTGNKLLGRVIRGILFPEAVDMRRPDRRFVVKPTWDKDAIIATFILVELLERRQTGARDITGILRAASATPRQPNFPIKLYRGGSLHRVKPHAHIESVLRGLMREPPLGALRPRSNLKVPNTDLPIPPDMLRPLTIDAYNDLLLFGLERQVSEDELAQLVDSMGVVGVEPNRETHAVLFRRTKLSQNKLVERLLERMPTPRREEDVATESAS